MKRIVWLTLAAFALSNCTDAGQEETSQSASAVAQDEQRQLMDRWNATVSSTPVSAVTTADLDFTWPIYDQFPHPTYKHGTAEAYQAFAAILIAFLQNDDNFQYLAQHGLFDARVGYRFANGSMESNWSFRELVAWFEADQGFFVLSEQERSELASLSERIEATR